MKNIFSYLTMLLVLSVSSSTHAQWTDPAPLVIAPAAQNLLYGLSLIELNGRPAVAVYDNANFELDFMRANDASGSSWPAPITIDNDFRAGFQSVDIEIVNGHPAVVADDAVQQEVRYTRATDANGASWGTTVIAASVGNANGGDLHIDLEVVSGNPAFAFLNSDDQSLRYVRANDADGTTWGTPVVVESTNSLGGYNSMEMVNGRPAIAFYDHLSKDLKFVRANDNTGSSWGSVQTIASAGIVGGFCSMAIVNGRPAIVYRDGGLGIVKYVRANNADGTSWATPVTVHGEDGEEFELMVINNIPVIAYRTNESSGDKDLAYITACDLNGSAWGTRQIVDGASFQTGRDLSLALINGNPAIAYRDFTNSEIQYTRAADDNTAPSTTSFTRKIPSAQNTSADQLTFLATFSEDVVNVGANDFSASGTTANISVTKVTASTYDILLSGGNLATVSGTVGLNFSGSVSIQDVAGNALPNTEPSTDQTYTLDNTPNAVCQNITVSLNSSNTISITASQIDNGSTVHIGSPSLSLSKTNFDCDDIGSNNVTLTVTDGNNQTDECTATVTVNPNASSGNNTWLGVVNSDWAEPCNWSYGSIPTASQIVKINASSNDPIIMAGTNAVAKRVIVSGTTVFTINATGSLTINGATNNGISINSISQLNNNGIVKIDNIIGSAGNRSGIALGGTLVNNGTIEIGKNGGNVNFGFYSNTGSLNNQSGAIDIEAAGHTSIWLQGSATGINNSCATILINKRLRVIQSATFQNDGFLWYGQNPTGNAISPFDNNGVVEDPNEVLPNSVTNNDLIISPISTTNGVFNNALEVGSSNSFTVASQWYKDENLTMLAGNYDAAMNKFTPIQANLPAGQHTLYFEVTDNVNNCSRTVQINVTVGYCVPPTAVCKNISINLSSSGSASIIASDIDNGSSVNCGSVELSASKTSFTCSDVGSNNVTLTVTDEVNQTDVCTATVTVNDVTDPTAVCKNISIDLDSDGNASITANQLNNGSADVCGTTNFSASQTAFDCSDIGTNNITLTVNDGNGNSNSCSSTVTVNDATKPEISDCPSNISKDTDAGVCTAVVTWTAPTGMDNCTDPQAVVRTMGDASGSAFPLGITTIKYTATDAATNVSDECSFTITVSDNEKPVISGCPDNISKDTDAGVCNAVVTWTAPTATDNCTSPQSIDRTMGGASGSTFPIGETTIKYTATDAVSNVSDECSFTITISDNEKPTIIGCPGNISKNTDTGECDTEVTWTAPTVTDNCTSPQSIAQTMGASSGSTFSIGTATITYAATDDANNEAVCSFIVTVTDNEKPAISGCPSNSSKNTESGECSAVVTWTAPTATDNCTSPQSISQTMGDPSGTAFAVGTTMIKYTATDDAGNSEECSFTITITENENPIAVCQNIDVQLDEDGMATVTAADIDNGSNDACGIASVDATAMTFDCDDLEVTHEMTITVTDNNNNTDQCTATITVLDEDNPCCPNTHILYVDASTPNDFNGDDWYNAVASFEEALEFAAKCENVTEIWVADGTYYPTTGTDRTAAFAMMNDIAIYGGFNGTETELSQRDPALYPTILSGDIGTQGDASDNSYHVFFHDDNGLDATAILDGFVIKNGNADYIGNDEKGGGMFNEKVSPTVRNCQFIDNSATRGGGAMYNFESGTTVDSCGFNNNSSSLIGGAVFNSANADATFMACQFTGNTAANNGGAMFNNLASIPFVQNCIFDNNTAGQSGGGIHNISSSPDVVNCLFTNNTADEGAAIANLADPCSPNIVNCTFSANDAGATGGIVRNMTNTTPTYTNCIFWGNASTAPNTVIADSPPGATVTYSIVEGGYPGIGNMDIDPMFVSATDLHLEPCSPALGRGDNSANGTMEEMDGNARIVGNIDLGVYERATGTGTPVIWTGNGDGENWSDAANWDIGAVPQKCNDVLIPAPHVVKVQGGNEGLGRTLEVELGAELITDPDGMTNIGN